MKYLIDTDIASYYLRGKFDLSNIFQKKGFQNIRLSRITVAELKVLAHRNPVSKINLSAICSLSQNLGILEIDIKTWETFSILKADTLNRGMVKGDFDILIASIAKRYGMIVITNNPTHYSDIIVVENWVRK